MLQTHGKFIGDREIERIPVNVKLSRLRCLPSEKANALLVQVKSMEKHSFPSSEAMDFAENILSKSNSSMIVMYQDDKSSNLMAYSFFVRWQRRILLHKICVHSCARGLGMGSNLLSEVIAEARQASCSGIDLWVDEARTPARKLYSKHGFQELTRVENYYAPGRTGIKMSLALDN